MNRTRIVEDDNYYKLIFQYYDLQQNEHTTDNIETLLTFMEENSTKYYETYKKTLSKYFKIDRTNITFEQAKRYIYLKYRLGRYYTTNYSGWRYTNCTDFVSMLSKFKGLDIEKKKELFNSLLDSIEYNKKNFKKGNYDIYNYLENIIFCYYNGYKNIKIDKRLIINFDNNYYETITGSFIGKINNKQFIKYINVFKNISSSKLNKIFNQMEEIPIILKNENLNNLWEKYEMKQFKFYDNIDKNIFLKDFYEIIQQEFKKMTSFNFQKKYDVNVFKAQLIIIRQWICLFNMYTENKINMANYINDINDMYDSLDNENKKKYGNYFSEFYWIFTN